ncbi:unnamed protein product [Caenorhabditis bovis]|uniref:Uncharacterized protein n=1 Tax=Caenorhabditis bovis TaxID=2654633 RepID=A0A8S1E3I3_9PELO|nr:unnamed protein product [Caenorhabditis bovis]
MSSFFLEKSLFDRTKEEWLELLYEESLLCSKPPPIGYDIGMTLAHLLAIPIYVSAFYGSIVQNSSTFQNYKKYVIFHTICNLAFEFHLSIVMKPVLYLPYSLVRFCGFWKFRYQLSTQYSKCVIIAS